MFTHADYMAKKCSHREYFAQFVNSAIIEQVRSVIGEDRIKASIDEYLNDIPLGEWDKLTGYAERVGDVWPCRPRVNVDLIKEAGEWITAGTLVSIAKEAARQIREGA
jgi:hypothetical protein